MIVKYIKKETYQDSSMTIGKTYVVRGIEADTYRIIKDELDPCLYEAN